MISRRNFLGASAIGLARVAMAQDEREPVTLAPSERLDIACIGVGGQGSYDIRTAANYGHNVVALCDPDWNIAGRMFERYPEAKKFKDYREMLDTMPDIDAVIIATPDHHHALATIAALKHGKHVYCEKPLTYSVQEARAVGEAAKKSGLATQMGNTGQASDGVRTLCEYIWAGAIGHVREVHVWTDRPIWPQGIERPAETRSVPAEMDWDLWLGPAPERPYHEIYHPFRWRGWWDFGTGALGDIGCHRLDATFRALKLGHPTSVEATSTKVNDETFPHASIVRYQFPARGEMPPVKVYWYDGGLMPERPAELEADRAFGDNGILYIGDEGTIWDGQIIPASKQREYKTPPETLPRSIGHWEEWFAACKGEKVVPGANFEFAGLLTEVVLLGNVALRTGRKLDWDGPKLRVTNVPEANAFLQRSYREGWSLT